ncbi:hypothetical protein LUZ62_017975 [Rhynchospora pubera]|uniref:Protein kinase domain-containing protein n=1 Tax=Rhynchospora pubera TaxID=906938 RepID=A0AAV8GKD9_9POAL|nr:hypothetical protein LUZ62_017975 [Rhynchospora pubera]
MQTEDTYDKVAMKYYANLTNTYFLTKFNRFPVEKVPDHATISVTVNCSCGDQSISKQFGLFVTYPLQANESSRSVAIAFNLSAAIVDEYNHGTSFSSAGGIVYVADFGLTKTKKEESMPISSKMAGTFGYMPPEYSHGEISPKTDVYAFGVVLYELISAKPAIVMPFSNSPFEPPLGLVGLFDNALSNTDPKGSLKELIDPRLGDECPIDSILKMAQLAKACTHKEPDSRPSMRSVVVVLMTLSSASESWDTIGNLFNKPRPW